MQPNHRFPCPAEIDNETTLSEADFRLTSNQFKHKRLAVKAALENFLPERPVLIVGVTKKIQVADGTDAGALHPGRAYQLARGDFIKLKLDPYRSPFLLCLEPRVPCMYFEVSRAINQIWPRAARNTFLATA